MTSRYNSSRAVSTPKLVRKGDTKSMCARRKRISRIIWAPPRTNHLPCSPRCATARQTPCASLPAGDLATPAQHQGRCGAALRCRVVLRPPTLHAGGHASLAEVDGVVVGATWGFLASHEGRLGLHSHVTGVLSAHANAGVGLALKHHQWQWASKQGLDFVTWTFDPLVRRNAYFNLVKLGANVRIEGHHAVVRGVDSLVGTQVSAPDIRAGAALVVAGLVAVGETRIDNVHHIDRGYDDLVGRLAQLGADVTRVES
ncbi:MAG: hypothetical protein EB130_07820 [Actinobacteria bacterium]|nr:hypothetical protein [Actinomycetota bacterium]